MFYVLKKSEVKGFVRTKRGRLERVTPFVRNTSRAAVVESLKRQIRALVGTKLETGIEVTYKGEHGWRVNQIGDTPGKWLIYRKDKPGVLKEVSVYDLAPTHLVKSFVICDLIKGRSIKEWMEYLKIDEPELAEPDHKFKSIGKSKKDGKWYGWSHRAIHGFPTRQQAKKFARSVS